MDKLIYGNFVLSIILHVYTDYSTYFFYILYGFQYLIVVPAIFVHDRCVILKVLKIKWA